MSALSRALLCSASFAFLLSPAFADDVKTAPTVYVTALRTPVPINQVASSVTVITHEEIEQQNKPTVTELLREVPGVAVGNNGGPNQPTSLFLRGTNSRHVLVVMDGVVMNDPSDPSDRFDFSNLTTDNIERIEVLRGPQSTLYGSQAIGGVIAITSKLGKGAPRTHAFAEYGSYNTRKVGVGNSGEIGNTAYSFQASEFHSSGQSSLSKKNGGFEKDGNQIYTLSGNVASRLSEIFTFKWNGRYNHSYTDTDSPGVFSFMAPRPADDHAAHNLTRQANSRVAGELKLFDGVWTQEAGLSILRVNRDAITSYYDAMLFDSPFGRQQYIGTRQKFDWIHNVQASKDHMITFGTEVSKDAFKTESLSEVDVWNTGYFIDDKIALWQDLYLNGSARIDEHQTFGRQFTWKVAPAYHISDTGTTLKFTYGTGFKSPSLAELFLPGTGNPDVMPETTKGWDMGFEQVLLNNKITFGSTFFRNDITNLLSNSSVYPYPSINIGKVRTQGVETTFNYLPDVDWKLFASHTYTLSQDRASDKDLLRRPRHQLTGGAVYQYNADGDIGVRARYSSLRRDGDIITFAPVYVKSFTTIDLTTNYRLNPTVSLYGRVDNLLDKEYEEVAGYTQPGLSGFVGIKANF